MTREEFLNTKFHKGMYVNRFDTDGDDLGLWEILSVDFVDQTVLLKGDSVWISYEDIALV